MRNTTNLNQLISQSMKIMNETVSKNTGKSPNENLEEATAAVAKKYNAKRAKAGKTRLRDIVPGKDKVRINLVGPKKSLDFKSYKAKTSSKTIYPVKKKVG